MKRLYITLLLTCILTSTTLFAQPKVAIRELLYDTPISEAAGSSNRYDGEFVSIQNFGKETINVSGWKLTSDEADQYFIFPSGSVMAPNAIFIVAYRNYSFSMSDLYNISGLQSTDRIFYQSAIIHANVGENVKLYRADGTLQDHLYYDGTSNKQKSPRLEAYNTGKPCEASKLLSIQRHTVTAQNGQIVFTPSDYKVATVSLAAASFERQLLDNSNIFNANPNAGMLDVSATGAATYTIPIACPEGIQEVQPNIALTYNSQARNGVAGWGWNVVGISAVARTGSTVYHDGKVAGVTLSAADNLTLDGQRLILVSGSHFASGAKYRTEVETFSDITYKTINGYLCFEVTTKEGQTLQYGASSDSYVNAQGSSTPYTWLLTKVADANGNYMTYTYGKDNTKGEFWLNKIAYTGNSTAGIAPVNEVVFEYEERQDVETYYVAGYKNTQSKRLSTITVKSGNQLFRKYALDYTFDGLYSKLTGVKEETADGIAYTPLEIGWSNDEYGSYSYIGKDEWANISEALDASPIFADFNGDGRRDFITVKDKKVKLFLWLPNLGFTKKCEYTPFAAHEENRGVFVADANGDGLMDIVSVSSPINGTYNGQYRYSFHLSNGEGFSYKSQGFYENATVNDYMVGDFDGDGKHDVLIKSSQRAYDLHNTPIAYKGGISWGTQSISSFPDNTFLLDITGNGKTNVCTLNSRRGYDIYELNDGAFQRLFSTPCDDNRPNGCDIANTYINATPGDYNGDGKVDLYVNMGYLLLSTGTSFEKKTITNINEPDGLFFLKGRSGDFNLDGKMDMVFVDFDEINQPDDGIRKYMFYVGINNGNGFTFQSYKPGYLAPSPNMNFAFSYLDVGDFNGDGRSEVQFFNPPERLFRMRSFNDSFLPHVTTIQKKQGGYTALKYAPLTNMEVYTTSNDDSILFPVGKALPPMHVVRSVLQNNQSTGYSYKNIRIHRQGKGFLGFEEVCMTNYTTEIKTTAEYGYNPSRYNVFPVKKTVATMQGAAISTTTYSNAIKSFGGVRIYPYASKQIIQDHLSNLSTTTDVLSFDDYGNPTAVRTTSGNITETVTAAYSQRGAWCPNKPDSTTTARQQGTEIYARTTLYEYDLKGNLVKETKDPRDVNRVVAEYKNFDSFGHARRVEATANGSTLTSTLSYTASGRFLASKSNALGETTTYQWDEKRGLLTSEINKLGLSTSYKYDEFGRLRETVYPDGNKQVQGLWWVTSDDYAPSSSARHYAYTQAADGAKSYVWFDYLGREICSQTLDLNDERISTFTEYNSKGLKYRISKPKRDSESTTWAETYSYDGYGRPVLIAIPRGNISYAYNGRTTTVTSPEGTKETARNAAGQVAASKVNGQAVNYTYFASGLTKSAIPEGGQGTTLEYDLQGNKTEIAEPNAGKITYRHNGFGQLVAQTDARGRTDSLLYDKLGRVVRKVTPAADYTYSYGNYGLDSIMRNDTCEYSFRYDSLGRPAAKHTYIEGSRYTFLYTYNRLGQVDTKKYPNTFTLSYGYTNGTLTAITNGSSTLWQLQGVNALGQPLSYTWGSGQQTAMAYDAHGFLESKTGSGQLPNQTYIFNATTGNLSNRNLGVAAEPFTYDSHHRLTGWGDKSMAYAENGNITSKSDMGSYEYSSLYPHAVQKLSDLDEELDEAQLIPQAIDYDSRNRPTLMVQGNNSLALYYDHTGQRLCAKQYKNGLLYKTIHYLGDYEKEIYADSLRTSCFINTPTGLHAVQEQTTKNGTTSTELLYVHTDHLGSIVALADANGSVLAEYSYDPWGNLRNPQTLELYGINNMPTLRLGRGFTGHEHLPEFGLINMNARLYDPMLGRFLNPDPYVLNAENSQDYNRYSYARNNPLIYTDPTGEFLWGAVAGFWKGVFTGKNPLKTAWQGAVNETKIWAGLFAADTKQSGWGWQILSRFTWQLPQTLLGYNFAQISNYAGQVDNVSYWGGATVLSGNNWGKRNGAATLSSYIIGGRTIAADPNNSLFQHEYGHYLQSQEMGWAYLSRVGLPSLMSAKEGDGNHDFQPFEQDANRRAFKYFNENVDGFYQTGEQYLANRESGDRIGWDFWSNPMDVNHIGTDSRYDYYDYHNIEQLTLVNSLSLRAKWYDYLGGIFFGIPTGIGNGIYYKNNRIK